MTETLNFNIESVRYSSLARLTNQFARGVARARAALELERRSEEKQVDFSRESRRLCQIGLDCINALNNDESATEQEVEALRANFLDFDQLLNDIISLPSTSFELAKDLEDYKAKAQHRADLVYGKTEARKQRDIAVERQLNLSFREVAQRFFRANADCVLYQRHTPS